MGIVLVVFVVIMVQVRRAVRVRRGERVQMLLVRVVLQQMRMNAVRMSVLVPIVQVRVRMGMGSIRSVRVIVVFLMHRHHRRHRRGSSVRV